MTDDARLNDDEELRRLFSDESGSERSADVEPDTEAIHEQAEADPVDERSAERKGNRLSTGIEVLDRELEGGIPPGRMIAFVAPPDSQSELLVKELATQRDTRYLSTFRPQWEIEEELRDFLNMTGDPDRRATQVTVEQVTPETLLAEPEQYIGDLGRRSNLVIDSINEFELEDRSRYVTFLNMVKKQLWETGSIGLFYGMEGDDAPIARSLTLKRADVVWQLRMSVEAKEISTRLVISKFRGGQALTQPIKLVLTDGVTIDTSRDIA